MMKFHKLSAGFVFGVATAASAAMAAAPSRIWVSGHGTDASGCSTPANPCRTLQYAHDTIAAGGEIDILDPAGYGAVTITKAVSIINDGVGTAGVQAASGNAITINAGPKDNVILRGLNVEGLGTASVGIQFNSGLALTIEQCTVRHFSNEGVFLNPVASQGAGTRNVNIQHSAINYNSSFGIYAESDPGVSMQVLIAHSDVSNNPVYSIMGYSNGGTNSMQIADITLFENGSGVVATGQNTSITVGGSSMDFTPSTAMGGRILSFGDNDVAGAFGTVISKH